MPTAAAAPAQPPPQRARPAARRARSRAIPIPGPDAAGTAQLRRRRRRFRRRCGTSVSAQDLLITSSRSASRASNPADYDPAGLDDGDPDAAIRLLISAAATDRFNRLSSDLALGHVKRSARIAWFMADNDLDAAKQDALAAQRACEHNIAAALNGLLPTHPQYAALKAALRDDSGDARPPSSTASG